MGHRRSGIAFIVSAALICLVIFGYAIDALQTTELSTVDARFALRGDRPAPDDIVLVLVDDVTFNTFVNDGIDAQWPFSRASHAKVIDRLRMDGAKVIAYDVQFTEPSGDPAADDALIKAVGRAGNVVLATSETDNGKSRVFGSEDVVRSVHARSGHVLVPFDADRVMRRFPYEVDGLESFAVAATETATGHPVDSSRFARGPAWIDFGGPPATVTSVSFSDVYKGNFKPGTFRGKIVVVGASASSLHDEQRTSTTTSDRLMPGPEIQANAIETLMEGLPLHSPATAVDIALIALLGMVVPLLNRRLSPLRTLAAALTVGGLFAVAAQVAFDRGWIVLVVYPLLALILCAIGTLAISYLTESFERARVRAYFARFVPEQVVDEVLRNVNDDLRLGGVRRTGTVMFTDLRGFTSYAEMRPPEQVIDTLNRYLTVMSDAILDNGGTVVAYMGDGIMAVFGVPISNSIHADQALAAAREMLDVRLPVFNEWLVAEGLGEGFRMGIGLNTGPVMSGNVGSERRLEYTCIGDTTNTAARIEAMTKGTPNQLLIADSTKQALSDGATDIVFVDEVPVRGKRTTIKLWTVTG